MSISAAARSETPHETRRMYNQYCGLATALDLVGTRWSLLVVRELMIAPCRFGELQRGLPGIGPNLLAERLADLTAAGVVEQRASPSGGRRQMYALTPFGQMLRPAVLELARWGLNLVADAPRPDEVVRSEWAMVAVEALIRGVRLGDDVNETYQFHVEDESFHVVVTAGRATVENGPARSHDLDVSADAVTFVQIGAGRVDAFAAVSEGRVSILGALPVALRCCALLGIRADAVLDLP